MALLHYVCQNSYSVFTRIRFSKLTKTLHLDLSVFSDSSKKGDPLLVRTFDFSSKKIEELSGVFLTNPPPKPALGDCFLTASSGCVREWSNRDGLMAKYTRSGWQFWDIPYGQIFLDKRDNAYKAFKDGDLVGTCYYADSRIVDKWFNFSDPEMSVISQAYSFIKTLPEFKDCIDA